MSAVTFRQPGGAPSNMPDINGNRERVRLLGIDTPESVAVNRPEQCFGRESASYLTSLLPKGTRVTLVRDIESRDQYDRLLAYVVRSSDQLFVNLDLLERGYAGVMIYEPNSFYRELFEEAENDAFRAGTGLWGVCALMCPRRPSQRPHCTGARPQQRRPALILSADLMGSTHVATAAGLSASGMAAPRQRR